MSENYALQRINFSGNTAELVTLIVKAFSLPKPDEYSIIEIGYEDCNIKIKTKAGLFVAKVFSQSRDQENIQRYSDIISAILAAGVKHPLLRTNSIGDKVLEIAPGVRAIMMEYIVGQTFFELGRTPNSSELALILEQAALVHQVDHKPPYTYDSWAIPNIETIYNIVSEHIEEETKKYILQIIERYKKLPADELPRSLVHGDFTKANVLKSEDGQIYILDFSVANTYPRIQELAVICANLMSTSSADLDLRNICSQVIDEYQRFNQLTQMEQDCLYNFTLAGLAMEFLGAMRELHTNGNDSEETNYWINLGRVGMKRELQKYI